MVSEKEKISRKMAIRKQTFWLADVLDRTIGRNDLLNNPRRVAASGLKLISAWKLDTYGPYGMAFCQIRSMKLMIYVFFRQWCDHLSNAPVAKASSIRRAAVSAFGALSLKSLKFISNAAILLSIASNWAEIFLNCSSMVKTEFWIWDTPYFPDVFGSYPG